MEMNEKKRSSFSLLLHFIALNSMFSPFLSAWYIASSYVSEIITNGVLIIILSEIKHSKIDQFFLTNISVNLVCPACIFVFDLLWLDWAGAFFLGWL